MKNNLQNNTPIEDKKLDWGIVQNAMKDNPALTKEEALKMMEELGF